MKVTREDILDAARRHFARTGYRQTSLAVIAEDLGVVKGALYYHVPGGKREMLDAVITREETRLLERMSCAAAAETNACAALRAAIRAKVLVMHERREELESSEEVLEEIKRLMAAEERPFQGQERELFGRLLGEGQRQGCIRQSLSREVAVHAIQALVRHFEMKPEFHAPGSAALENLLDVLENGLADSQLT